MRHTMAQLRIFRIFLSWKVVVTSILAAERPIAKASTKWNAWHHELDVACILANECCCVTLKPPKSCGCKQALGVPFLCSRCSLVCWENILDRITPQTTPSTGFAPTPVHCWAALLNTPIVDTIIRLPAISLLHLSWRCWGYCTKAELCSASSSCARRQKLFQSWNNGNSQK